jgi:hypothetical protein
LDVTHIIGKGKFYMDGRGQLAYPGLKLDKERHEYTYNGHKLSGVTGAIGARMGKAFPADYVEEHRTQGSHVHDAIEAYLRTGIETSVHPAVRWAVEQIKGWEAWGYLLFSETLITDRKMYASAIDILAISPGGELYLFDTKAGNFMRESVSWQLGIYKYFLHGMTGWYADRCYCLSTKDADIYPIVPRSEADVKKLLYGK